MKIKNVHGAPLLLLIISVLLIISRLVKMPFLSDEGNVYLASAVLQVLIHGQSVPGDICHLIDQGLQVFMLRKPLGSHFYA